jgi:RsiG-like
MHHVDSFPDIPSMSTQALKSLLDVLATEERDLAKDSERSYKLRVVHGKIDIVRAELVKRRGAGGSPTREPRRPNPRSDAGAIALPVPEEDHDDERDVPPTRLSDR